MKRILSLLLAILMLIGTVGLVACGGNDAPVNTEESSEVADVTEGTEAQSSDVETEPVDMSDVLEVEKADYNGKELVILQRTGTKAEMYTEKYSGDLIADTVYDRNLSVEAYLNVKLKFADETGTNHTFSVYKDKIMNSLQSGKEEFHIVANYAYFGATMAVENAFTDLNGIPAELNHIDTSKVWWNDSYVEQATVNNRLYFMVGDITTTAIDRMIVTFYNDQMVEEFFPDVDLNRMVYDGEWTYSYFLECLKATGDGSTNGGIWAVTMPQNSTSIDGFLAALAIDIVERNSRGGVEINFNTDRTQTIAQALRELYHNNKAVCNDGPEALFETGNSIFYLGMMLRARDRFRNATFDYGMLPLPKWDEDQEGYRTTPHDEYSILGIPSNVHDSMEIVTATLEVMAAESYKQLRPAIIEESYKSRDLVAASGEMFDYIIGTTYFDFGYIYSNGMGNPVHTLRNYAYYEDPTHGSYIGSLPEAMVSASTKSATLLKDFVAKFFE